MLAFIDNPIAIMVVLGLMLLLFGPEKLPEMGKQLGKALRDLKKTTQEISNSFSLDDRHETPYEPPRYDSYGNYNDPPAYTVPEQDIYKPEVIEIKPLPALEAHTDPHSDFAASAFSDFSADYGVAPDPTSAKPPEKSEMGSAAHRPG